MKGGIGSTIVDIIGIVVGAIGKVVHREDPKRATDIFHANPSELERLRDEARRAEGMSTVYRSEPPARGPNAPREDLP